MVRPPLPVLYELHECRLFRPTGLDQAVQGGRLGKS